MNACLLMLCWRKECFTSFRLLVILFDMNLCFCVEWQTQTLVDTSQGSVVTTGASQKHPPETPNIPRSPPPKLEIPLNCTAYNLTRTCPSNYPTTFSPEQDPESPSPPPTCPEYFRWINEDLRPWAQTGITKDMVQSAKRTANFKLVILNGKAYLETYQKSFQTRDVFTLWGILQLLRRYPGKVPDLELMFDCVDWPVILSRFYSQPNSTVPPPLFRYCGDDRSLDIVFPDWSFWGWYDFLTFSFSFEIMFFIDTIIHN